MPILDYFAIDRVKPEQPPYLSARQLAAMLTQKFSTLVTEAMVRRWARKGRIKSRKVSNLRRYLWWEIEADLERVIHLLGIPRQIRPSSLEKA